MQRICISEVPTSSRYKFGAAMVPRNCALYAEAVEYSPVAESFHLMVSCVPFCSTVCRTRPQSCTNSTKCVMLKVVVFLISRIQLLFCKASATVRHFLLEALNKFGAMSLGRRPCSQPDCQNFVFFPSPMVIVVQAAKRSRSVSSQGISEPTHAFSGETHSCHSQRSRRAREDFSKFRSRRSPISLGRQEHVQLILHFPPVSILSPAHREALADFIYFI